MSADRFDDIARKLAEPLSRRGALKILAATVVGGLFAGTEAGSALAGKCIPNNNCAHWCALVFGTNTPADKQCAADANKCKGACQTYGNLPPSSVCCTRNSAGYCTSYTALSACGTGQHCVNGTCTCDSTSCPSGCCSGSTCLAGTSATACGTSGATCASCAAATCTNGSFTGAGTCTNQTCVAGSTSSCSPYACNSAGTACLTSCSSSSDCASGFSCINGVCGKLTSGSPCTGGTQCQTGNCVNGVCCTMAGCEDCQACNVSGHEGTCWAVANGTTCSTMGGKVCQNGICVACIANTDCGTGQVCCGNTCVTGTCCSNGDCTSAGQLCCSHACVTGTCCTNSDCPVANGTGTCSSNTCQYICDSSYATCSAPCDTNIHLDFNNCGGCGNVCDSTTADSCFGGSCHCGSNMPCSTGQTCVSGACQCPSGQTLCGGSCTTTSTDNANCGSCGHACGTAETCVSGTCTPLCSSSNCANGCCDSTGTCVTSTSVSACGTNGSACVTCQSPPSGQGTVACTSGTCDVSCDSGYTLCNGDCVDLTSDPNNCGDCNIVCPSNICSASTCVATCTDGVMNGNETDVDCGGPDCPPCQEGQGCYQNTDCQLGCCAGGICDITYCT